MAITITTVYARPDTSAEFYYNIVNDVQTSVKSSLAPHRDTSSLLVNATISNDNLNLTLVSTAADLTALGIRANIMSVALDNDFTTYTTQHSHTRVSYTMVGIDAPFTCTTVYHFPTPGSAVETALNTQLSDNIHGRLSNLIVTTSTITAIHTYSNDADYSTNFWSDFSLIPDLHAAGATRTINYAMV